MRRKQWWEMRATSTNKAKSKLARIPKTEKNRADGFTSVIFKLCCLDFVSDQQKHTGENNDDNKTVDQNSMQS